MAGNYVLPRPIKASVMDDNEDLQDVVLFAVHHDEGEAPQFAGIDSSNAPRIFAWDEIQAVSYDPANIL